MVSRIVSASNAKPSPAKDGYAPAGGLIGTCWILAMMPSRKAGVPCISFPTTRPIPGSRKDGFQHAFDLIERASEALLREIQERRSNVRS